MEEADGSNCGAQRSMMEPLDVAEYDVAAQVRDFRINGFVVFEDLIPYDTLDRISEAWRPFREADVERQGEMPIRGRFRYNVRVPFVEPFVDETIFEHPALVAFLEEILGEDYVCFAFDSNIPYPGTDYQKWHRDGYHELFEDVILPTYQVGVKFPLVDTTEENGSIEVIPCTQFVLGKELPENLDDLVGTGANERGTYHSTRLNLKKGSMWIHDNRVILRGTPNHTDEPRDELCMPMSSSWLHPKWLQEETAPQLRRELWNSLSDHARQVLRWQRVG